MKMFVVLFILLGVSMMSCQSQQEDLLQERLRQAEEYMIHGDYKDAIWILKQAEEQIEASSTASSAKVYRLLAELNHKGGDYERAFYYENKEMEVRRQLPQADTIFQYGKEDGSIYFAKLYEMNGQIFRAESLYVKAIRQAPEEAYYAYWNLAELYERTLRSSLADNLIHQASQNGTPILRKTALQKLYQRHLAQKDTAQALVYLQRYVELVDSVSASGQKENLLSAQAQYNQEVAARKKAEMHRNYLLLFIASFVVVGGIAYGWRKKVVQERRTSSQALQTEQEANKEKEIKINQLKAIQGIRKDDVSLTREQIAAFDYYIRFKETPTDYSAKEDRKKLACWLDMAHNDFAIRLKSTFPELTPREEDICYLLRLGYSVVDIKDILGMAQTNSVTKAISRTCDKLHLDNRQKSLSEFILNF